MYFTSKWNCKAWDEKWNNEMWIRLEEVGWKFLDPEYKWVQMHILPIPPPPKWNVLKLYSGMEFFEVLRDLTEAIWAFRESSSLEMSQYVPIYRVENDDEMSDRVCIITTGRYWFSSDPAWTWAGFTLMGFFELKFKLLVSSKNNCKGGFMAELQTWPSLMSQLTKTLLNLLSVSRDAYLLLCWRCEHDIDFCQSLARGRFLPFSSFCVVHLFSCYIWDTEEMCRMQTFMQKIYPLYWICSIIGSYP